MGFQQGLSGLNASSKNLEVIGNNVANANTYGSKVARAEFSDVYAAAINGAGTSTIGIGTNLAAVAQQFTQGNITTTSNPMDLAINGAGFFQVSDGVNPVSYTRNGQFKVDRDGFIVNNAAQRLVGYPADGLGQIQPGQATAIQLPTGGIAPNASTEGLIEANLDADKPVSNPGEVARNLGSSTAGDLVSGTSDALDAVDDAVAVLAGMSSPSALATAAQTAVTAARTAAAAAETAAQAAADAYPTATQAQAEANAAAAEAAASAAATAAAAAVAAVDTALDAEPANADLTRALTAMQGASARIGTTVTQAAEHSAAVDNVPTAAAGAQIDFDDADTYNDRTTLTFYDVQGREVPVTFYFQKSAPQTWNVFAEVGGVPLSGSTALPAPVTTLQYPEGGGAPISPNGPITLDIPVSTNGAGVPTQAIAGIQLNLGGISQYAADFGVTNSQQDGFSAGVLTSIAIEDNGIVSARYSNGQSRPAGQIEIATFRNPQGLQPTGDNNWMRTFASGDPVVGTPGAGNLGVLQSGALEESNVDITGELVNMITAQRIYQANAQSIKTTDQILQTIVNLR